jgi:hypothetical protein
VVFLGDGVSLHGKVPTKSAVLAGLMNDDGDATIFAIFNLLTARIISIYLA